MEKFAHFIFKKRQLLFTMLAISAIVCGYLMTLVVVNMDITKYLPEDSSVRAGISAMEEAFGEVDTPVLHVMLAGINDIKAATIYEQFSEFEQVIHVAFDPESSRHINGEFTLYTLTLQQGLTDDEAYEFIQLILNRFSPFNVELSGNVAGVDIDVNMMLIIVPTVIILTIILFSMCRSFVEPILLFINIAIAILINMGTNIIFDSVSDITQMIAGLLQVALSMDYSIIFLNRYHHEKEIMATVDHKLAMKNAIRNSFSTISGISFTTIVGMLMLVFMSFTIGRDIGFVIAKGVFISLICVFGVMPALILWFDKWIDKTRKPVLTLKMGPVSRFSYKGRYVISGLFVALFIGAFLLQNQIDITYSEVDYDPVQQVFDIDNTFVILYETKDEAQVEKFIHDLEQRIYAELTRSFVSPLDYLHHITDIQAYSQTLGEPFNERQMASALEMDELMVGLIFRNYFTPIPGDVLLGSFMQFLELQAAHHPLFAPHLDFEEIGEPITHDTPMHAPGLTALHFTNEQVAELFNLDIPVANQLLHLYHLSHGDLFSLEGREILPDVMTMPTFLDYLITDFSQISMFQMAFPREVLSELETALTDMSHARALLVTDEFSRMIITTTLPVESEVTFIFIQSLLTQLDELLTGEFYILGPSVMPFEMHQTFPDEQRFITLLTTIAFFIVVALTFKSFPVSIILATAIQGAVFVTMGVTYFQDGGIMFLPLIIAQVLLKSRVIDYGILYTANYIEARKTHGIKDAMVQGLNHSIDTILTSGLIIVLVTFIVGLIFRGVNVAISEILLLIAQGCFIGVMLSVFVLPSLIAVFDRFIMRSKVKGH